MDTLESIRTRRSIRRFADQEIGDQSLRTILEAVQQAPSWANMQCWRLIVVRDRSTRERISELSYVEAFLAPKGFKANPAKKGIAEAPAVIIFCADPERSGELWGQTYYMTDIGIAYQNLALAANALGLGTVFAGIFDENAVRQLLGIPSHIRVVGIVPVGYPRDEKKEGPPRKSLEEFVSYEKWSDEKGA